MIALLAALLVAAPPPVEPGEVDEVVVQVPRPETVFCVRYFKQAAWRTPKMTCKTWIEWRAIKGARHDSRTRTGQKWMERGFMMDTAPQEEAIAASVRPRTPKAPG